MMKHSLKSTLFALLFLAIAPVLVLAQGTDCPEIVHTALAAASKACADTGRNQACYGNVDMTVQPQPGAQNFVFNKTGDIVDVSTIQSMVLSPMDESGGKWGVALLKLQANLPDTLPGQNVTFLLFGDVQLVNGVTADNASTERPMQSFYLSTGAGDAKCEESPQSGMLVQTPQGVGEVTFNVNGVDVQMGSTVFFQAQPNAQMTVSTLEGAAYITAKDKTEVIVPGSWARIALGTGTPQPTTVAPSSSSSGGAASSPIPVQPIPALLISEIVDVLPSAAPEAPRSYGKRLDTIQSLPLVLLDRPIQIAAPLTDDEIQLVNDRINEGVLCGEDPLPACPVSHAPDGSECIVLPGSGLPPGEDRPLCPSAPSADATAEPGDDHGSSDTSGNSPATVNPPPATPDDHGAPDTSGNPPPPAPPDDHGGNGGGNNNGGGNDNGGGDG